MTPILVFLRFWMANLAADFAAMPDSPALANGRVTLLNCSDPTVKDVAVPISPLALKNEIVPVQDGAVLVPPASDTAVAVFTTVIEAVSLLPRPTGGKLYSRVRLTGTGVETCPHMEETAPHNVAAEISRSLRQNIVHLFLSCC